MEAKCVPGGKVNLWLLVLVVALVVGLGGTAAACGGRTQRRRAAARRDLDHDDPEADHYDHDGLHDDHERGAHHNHPGRARDRDHSRHPLHDPEGRVGSPVTRRVCPERGGPLAPGGDAAWGHANKTWLQAWATKVAQRGAVVFVPDWGRAISNYGSTITPATIGGEELRASARRRDRRYRCHRAFRPGHRRALWRGPRAPHALRPFRRS